jgi:hypothetical protein
VEAGVQGEDAEPDAEEQGCDGERYGDADAVRDTSGVLHRPTLQREVRVGAAATAPTCGSPD